MLLLQKDISFSIDSDVYEKLTMALKLTGDDENEMFENCLKAYIAKTFGAVSQEFSPASTSKVSNGDNDYYGKAIQRIPVWSLKPNQYNHKIIRAFLIAERNTGRVTIDTMEGLCSNKDKSELYVPTFKNNYAQMKIDGPKSHGKVFEDDGENVWLWKEVEEVIRKYQNSFMS